MMQARWKALPAISSRSQNQMADETPTRPIRRTSRIDAPTRVVRGLSSAHLFDAEPSLTRRLARAALDDDAAAPRLAEPSAPPATVPDAARRAIEAALADAGFAFASVPAAQRARLVAVFAPVACAAGDALARRGEPGERFFVVERGAFDDCLLYTSPSPRDRTRSRMPSSA